MMKVIPRHHLNYEAVQAINAAIDLGYEDSLKKEYDIDVFKYRLERTFAQLIENLYPSK